MFITSKLKIKVTYNSRVSKRKDINIKILFKADKNK